MEQGRRKALATLAGVMGAGGVAALAYPFVRYLEPAADVRAKGVIEVDLSGVPAGELRVVQWRGKPLFILHRTPEMIQSLYGHDDLLRDPMS
ncbi:MAG: ubiquinol-cytochrome c reductase iron-sulfur subunit, partial [Zetaproteobacteria bacterium]